MFQEFFLKRMIASKLGQFPKEQQDLILAAFEKDPDFFLTLGKEIETKIKAGKDQNTAAMEVCRERQGELKKLLS